MTNPSFNSKVLTVAVLVILSIIAADSRILSHKQSSIEQQNMAYYQALSQQERDAQVSLANLKKEIEYLHETIGQVQDLPSMKTIALEEGLADERDLLYSIEKDLTVPLRLKSVQCKNLTDQQLQSINERIDKIERQTEVLETTINGLSNQEHCSVCGELKREYKWDILYLRRLKQTLEPCPEQKPSENDLALAELTKYNQISNLNSDAQWIYGNSTEADYYMNILNQNGGKNVSKCPLETPFIAKGQTECSECPERTPVFDISLQKCVSCPGETQYSSKSHKCLINGVDCGAKTYNLQTEQCECPAARPYWNEKECISCISPEFFNEETLACDRCPELEIYNVEQKKCLPRCQATHIFNEELQECECPETAPFDDGESCVACYLPHYWNLDDKSCEFCKAGFFYDIQQRKCTQCPEANPKTKDGKCYACPEGTVYDAESNSCGQGPHECPYNKVWNHEDELCECPRQTPFDTGSECVACYLPNYWSHSVKQCLSCPTGQIYDYKNRKCSSCPIEKPVIIGYVCGACEDGLVYDMDSNTCVEGQKCDDGFLYSSKEGECICPRDTPFEDASGDCVSCYLPHYWDHNDKKCKFCPENMAYNTEKGSCNYCSEDKPVFKDYECFACPEETYYKKEDNACYTIHEYCESNYELNVETYTCQCPEGKPYENGEECVECNPPHYWDLETLTCKSCPANFFYNIGDSECKRCPQDKPIFKLNLCVACPAGTKFIQEEQACVGDQKYCELTFPDRNFVYDEESNECICPEETPFDDGEKCVFCYLPKYWDHDTKQCLFCEANQYYNTDFKKCVHCPEATPILSDDKTRCIECPEGFIFREDENTCVDITTLCESNYVFNIEDDKCVCPRESPFDNGAGCVNCVLPHFWSVDKKKCLSCPQNFIYDTFIKKCVRCPEDTPLLVDGQTECSACPEGTLFDKVIQSCKNINQFCNSGQELNLDTRKCECPRNKPFFDGQSCVSCYLPKYWNYDNLSCDECAVNHVYDTKLKRCLRCHQQTPVTSEDGMKCVACPENYLYDEKKDVCVSFEDFCENKQVYNPAKKDCECPRDRPFFTGSECVSCYLPKYWNHDTIACEWCEDNHVYNTSTKRCEACPEDKPVTDSQKRRCVEKSAAHQ